MSAFQDADLEHNRLAVAFVQSLAQELNAGSVRVPSSPEAALRLQRALSSIEVDPAVVATAASSEPALAMRIMRMANSTMLNPMGREIRDLRTAISRMGYNMVRTAAVGFMLEQLRAAATYGDLRPRLDALWEEGFRVAAFSTVIARRQTRLNADVAMLAGLLQGVGKLCILTRLSAVPVLRDHAETCDRVLRDWHAGVARAVVQSWSLTDEVADAVETCHNFDRELHGEVTLADVLTTALLLSAATVAGGEKVDFAECAGRYWRHFERLGLDAAACTAVAEEAGAQVSALQSALAG